MNTTNGFVDLTRLSACQLQVLDLNGFKTTVRLGRVMENYQRFYIHPHTYGLINTWKIHQPNGFIYVSDLVKLVDPIHKKYGKIYNKFNQLKDFILTDSGCCYCGLPDIDSWIDKNLIISK